MALSIVRDLHEQYAKSLFDENSKTAEEPDRVVQLINAYCMDVETILSELESYTSLLDVDFSKLVALIQQVEEKSSRIGAEQVRLSCLDLVKACNEMPEKSFSKALSCTRSEFTRTRSKLEVFAQMERKILRLEAKQHNRRSN